MIHFVVPLSGGVGLLFILLDAGVDGWVARDRGVQRGKGIDRRTPQQKAADRLFVRRVWGSYAAFFVIVMLWWLLK